MTEVGPFVVVEVVLQIKPGGIDKSGSRTSVGELIHREHRTRLCFQLSPLCKLNLNVKKKAISQRSCACCCCGWKAPPASGEATAEETHLELQGVYRGGLQVFTCRAGFNRQHSKYEYFWGKLPSHAGPTLLLPSGTGSVLTFDPRQPLDSIIPTSCWLLKAGTFKYWGWKCSKEADFTESIIDFDWSSFRPSRSFSWALLHEREIKLTFGERPEQNRSCGIKHEIQKLLF